MNAHMKREGYTLHLQLTEYELEQILGGLGATSERSRENAGMTNQQAVVVGELYAHIRRSVEELE